MRIHLFLLGILIWMTLGFSSDSGRAYPKDFFEWPVKHVIKLSGTFGELRPNHFHAGVDLKARKGRIGDPLYAAGPGHISRIKISPSGYGRVLYMDHPNGFTTVYAHMEVFSDDLEAYVKDEQYKQQKFEIELFPEKNRFYFEKGAYIGKMGTTGSSFGPHLHFEIRDTYSEKPINPLLFGLEIPDRKPPRLHQLKVYGLDEHDQTVQTKTIQLVRRTNGYGVKGDTIYVGSDLAGLALKAYDHHDNVTNWNGIYGLEMEVEQELYYQFVMESFSFDETRYINAHVDYPDRLLKKSYFNRCFALPGNALSAYSQLNNRGIIDLSDGRSKKVAFSVWDVDDNEVSMTCWIKRSSKDAAVAKKPYNYWLPHGEEHIIQEQGATAHFPKQCFYQDVALDFRISEDASSEYYSPVYHIHNSLTPIHKYFDLRIKPNRNIVEATRSKAFIGYCTSSGKVYNCGGTWEGDELVTKVNWLGDYAILLDEKPPRITNRSFKEDMRGQSYFSLTVKDDVSTNRLVKGINFRATIDGAWVLVEYDKKNNRLEHRFEKDLPRGEHVFRLEAWDAQGNLSIFERNFLR